MKIFFNSINVLGEFMLNTRPRTSQTGRPSIIFLSFFLINLCSAIPFFKEEFGSFIDRSNEDERPFSDLEEKHMEEGLNSRSISDEKGLEGPRVYDNEVSKNEERPLLKKEAKMGDQKTIMDVINRLKWPVDKNTDFSYNLQPNYPPLSAHKKKKINYSWQLRSPNLSANAPERSLNSLPPNKSIQDSPLPSLSSSADSLGKFLEKLENLKLLKALEILRILIGLLSLHQDIPPKAFGSTSDTELVERLFDMFNLSEESRKQKESLWQNGKRKGMKKAVDKIDHIRELRGVEGAEGNDQKRKAWKESQNELGRRQNWNPGSWVVQSDRESEKSKKMSRMGKDFTKRADDFVEEDFDAGERVPRGLKSCAFNAITCFGK